MTSIVKKTDFLEKQPGIGSLLLVFNSMTKDYSHWQVAVAALFLSGIFTRLRDICFNEVSPYQQLKNVVFKYARYIPAVSNRIKSEIAKTALSMEKSMIKMPEDWSVNKALPDTRMADDQVLRVMQELQKIEKVDERLLAGKVSGTIYTGGPDFEKYTDMLNKATAMFQWSNPLHPGVFPAVRQMEAEVIRMVCDAFHGGPTSCGVVTSGGTESICMAMRAYKEYGLKVRGITKPNVVMPRTAHPAFDKGCAYFGIALRKVQEDPVTRSVSAAAMKQAADSNTIAIVGSCPQYPHGAVDPIADLGKLAKKLGCGLHVDCCLGSFLVPFMRSAGFDFPDFDFSVAGVTSISCDTHKYGMAPKGTSVLMYSDPKYRKHQYSVFPDWPGGIYGTPSVAGSRSGSIIAATWAAMMSHGKQGYTDNCKKIVGAARKIGEGIKKIDGLKLVCDPAVSVVAWTSDKFDINRLVEGIVEKKGWDLNVLQFPSSIHIACTLAHTSDGVPEAFLSDLAECTAEMMKNPGEKAQGSAAMYGMAQAIPDRTIIEDIVKTYIDTTTKLIDKPHEH